MSTEQGIFRQFANSLPFKVGTVIVMCPVCYQIVRTYETRVTALNDYAFTADYETFKDANGSFHTRLAYTCVERNSNGCEHVPAVKPEPSRNVAACAVPASSDLSFDDLDF